MPAAVAPYSAADTASAASWLPYISAAYLGPGSVADADATARRAIALLRRTDQITDGAASLLLQIFDLTSLDFV